MARILFVSVFLFFGACTRTEAPKPSSSPQAHAPNAVVVSGPTVSLSGTVRYTGPKVTAETIKMSADNTCVKENAGRTVTRHDMVVSKEGGLKNVIVSVKEGAPKGGSAAAPVVLDQKGCMYSPHVLAVQVGQTIQIKNSDPTLHNVNAVSKLSQGFNFGMPTLGQVTEKKFTRPEYVRLKCDVHGWMSAYVGVFDHPHFAVSDAEGKFTLPALPQGSYVVEAWHEKLGTKTQPVTLSATGATVDFQF